MGHKAMKVPGVIVQLQVVLWSPSTSVISGDEDGDGDGDGLVWLGSSWCSSGRSDVDLSSI